MVSPGGEGTLTPTPPQPPPEAGNLAKPEFAMGNIVISVDFFLYVVLISSL